MLVGFVGVSLVFPFVGFADSLLPCMALWVAYGLALALVDAATDDRAVCVKWNDWGVALIDRRGEVLRSMAFGAVDRFSYSRVAPNCRSLTLASGARVMVISSRVDLASDDVDVAIEDARLVDLHVELLRHTSVEPSAEVPRDRARSSSWRALVVAAVAWIAIALLAWGGACWSPEIEGLVVVAQACSFAGVFVAHRFHGRMAPMLASVREARGAERWRVVRVDADTARVARGDREIAVEASGFEDPRSRLDGGAALGALVDEVLVRAPSDEGAYRSGAPRAFPGALRARRVVRAAALGVLLSMPMLAPVLIARWVPGAELLRSCR